MVEKEGAQVRWNINRGAEVDGWGRLYNVVEILVHVGTWEVETQSGGTSR